MQDLRRYAIAVLYYCKRENKSSLSFIYDRPVKNLLEKVNEHPDFQGIFEVEIAEELICSYLSSVLSEEKDRYNNEDADHFLQNLLLGLKKNISEHWVIFPLRGAYLTKTVRYKDFVFIAGNIDEKTDVLRKLGKTSVAKAKERVNYTFRYKSADFFKHPLLAIRLRHQHGYVTNVARKISFYTNCFLHAIYWGKVYPKYELPLFHNTYERGNTKHLLIYGKEDWCIRHLPTRFIMDCELNLDFLTEKRNMELFNKIYNQLINQRVDKISLRFLNGFKFLKKAVELENKEDIYQGLSIPLLLLTTASECILLKREDAKRNRLSVLYSRLVKLENLTPIDTAKILNVVYGWRSEFVHGGTEIYKDYEDDLSEGMTTQTYINYKRLLSNLLCKLPHFMSMINRRNQETPELLKEECWYKYLENHWRRGRGIKKQFE